MISLATIRSLVSLFTSVSLAALLMGGCSSDGADNTADPAALTAPPAGQGVQLKTGAFAVDPNTEVQNCYFFKVSDLEAEAGLPTDQPLEVHRVQVVQKPGSHHMNVFRVSGPATMLDPTKGTVTGLNGTGQCFNSANWVAVAAAREHAASRRRGLVVPRRRRERAATRRDG